MVCPQTQFTIIGRVRLRYFRNVDSHDVFLPFSYPDTNMLTMSSVPANTEFDLETMRGKLDEKGMSIAEYQELSVKSRKHLAEKTKGEGNAATTPVLITVYYTVQEVLATQPHPCFLLKVIKKTSWIYAEFRANVTPEIFKQLSPLLKLYQQEVDALTSRAKLGESSFLDVFKLLYDAPDPAPTIASGLVR